MFKKILVGIISMWKKKKLCNLKHLHNCLWKWCVQMAMDQRKYVKSFEEKLSREHCINCWTCNTLNTACGLRETAQRISFKQRRADEKQMDRKEVWPRVSRQLLIFCSLQPENSPHLSVLHQSVPCTLSFPFPFCLHLLSLLQSVLHFTEPYMKSSDVCPGG